MKNKTTANRVQVQIPYLGIFAAGFALGEGEQEASTQLINHLSRWSGENPLENPPDYETAKSVDSHHIQIGTKWQKHFCLMEVMDDIPVLHYRTVLANLLSLLMHDQRYKWTCLKKSHKISLVVPSSILSMFLQWPKNMVILLYIVWKKEKYFFYQPT